MSPNHESTRRIPSEHQTQLELLDDLIRLVKEGEAHSEVTNQVDRLVSYTGLHFLSEQLLMRDANYADYDDHAEDHQRILEFLRNLQGRRPLSEGDTEAIRHHILRHMSHHDHQLHMTLERNHS